LGKGRKFARGPVKSVAREFPAGKAEEYFLLSARRGDCDLLSGKAKYREALPAFLSDVGKKSNSLGAA